MSSLPRDDLYSTAEAAAYIKLVSKSWLEHERAAGRGPAVVRIGRKAMYLRADLDAFIDSHRRNPGAGKWVSTNDASTEKTSGHDASTSGGRGSRSRTKSSANQLAQQIADELFSKSADSAPTTKPRHLIVATKE